MRACSRPSGDSDDGVVTTTKVLLDTRCISDVRPSIRYASNSARTDGGNGALLSTELERTIACVLHALLCDFCAVITC